MSHRVWLAALFCWPFVFASSGSASGEHPTALTSADLAGVKCQLWTVLEDEGRNQTSTCYEGVIKTVNKTNAIIIAKRLRIRRTSTFLGFGMDNTGAWTPLDDKEITVPIEKIDYIRFLKEPTP